MQQFYLLFLWWIYFVSFKIASLLKIVFVQILLTISPFQIYNQSTNKLCHNQSTINCVVCWFKFLSIVLCKLAESNLYLNNSSCCDFIVGNAYRGCKWCGTLIFKSQPHFQLWQYFQKKNLSKNFFIYRIGRSLTFLKFSRWWKWRIVRLLG